METKIRQIFGRIRGHDHSKALNMKDKKLREIFEHKYMELAFSDPKMRGDGFSETWASYLEHLGCVTWERATEFQSLKDEQKKQLKDCQIINDPSPFGGFILVPMETAEKILVLGLL